MDEKHLAQEFFREYLKRWIIAVSLDPSVAAQKYSLDKSWTDFHMNNILRKMELAFDMNIKGNNGKRYLDDLLYGETWATEYFRLDLSLYRHDKDFRWFLDYAIEHENKQFILGKDKRIHRGGWLNEFVKLIPLHCLLKVVISYDNFTGGANDTTVFEKIEYAVNLLDEQENKRPLDKTPFLIILGSSIKYCKKHGGEIKGFYVYFDMKWKYETIEESVLKSELDNVKARYQSMNSFWKHLSII